jgi:hypothetical protein
MSVKHENSQTREVGEQELETLAAILKESLSLTEQVGAPCLTAGSLACNHWGRPVPPGDLDLVVTPQDARRLLKAFDSAGYETEEAEEQWLYKASKDGVTVDLIFQMQGSLYLDDQMLEHASLEEILGVPVRLMGPEDFIVSQALSAREDTADYWYNAVGVLTRWDIDWDYLTQRASKGPRRVLSVLIYAQSDDLPVPDSAIRRLFETTYGR